MFRTQGAASPLDDFRPPGSSWSDYEFPELPDISDVLEAQGRFDPPWYANHSLDYVDEERTLALHRDWNHRVRLENGIGRTGTSRSGVTWMRAERTGWRQHQVANHGRAGTIIPWNPFPAESIPLPDRETQPVFRYGDPDPAGFRDWQAFVVDPDRMEVWELSGFGPSGLYLPAVLHVPVGRQWKAGTIVRRRQMRPWTEVGALSAAGLPMLDMTVRYEQLTGQSKASAVQLVAPHYNGDMLPTGNRWVNDARKTDGLTPGHPLWAGDRLRLRYDFEPAPGASDQAHELVRILQADTDDGAGGAVVADKSSNAGPRARPGVDGAFMPHVSDTEHVNGYSLRIARDPRIDLSGLEHMTIADFEVLVADED